MTREARSSTVTSVRVVHGQPVVGGSSSPLSRMPRVAQYRMRRTRPYRIGARLHCTPRRCRGGADAAGPPHTSSTPSTQNRPGAPRSTGPILRYVVERSRAGPGFCDPAFTVQESCTRTGSWKRGSVNRCSLEPRVTASPARVSMDGAGKVPTRAVLSLLLIRAVIDRSTRKRVDMVLRLREGYSTKSPVPRRVQNNMVWCTGFRIRES